MSVTDPPPTACCKMPDLESTTGRERDSNYRVSLVRKRRTKVIIDTHPGDALHRLRRLQCGAARGPFPCRPSSSSRSCAAVVVVASGSSDDDANWMHWPFSSHAFDRMLCTSSFSAAPHRTRKECDCDRGRVRRCLLHSEVAARRRRNRENAKCFCGH